MSIEQMWRDHKRAEARRGAAVTAREIRRDFGPSRRKEANALVRAMLGRLGFNGRLLVCRHRSIRRDCD